tara:strand:+ start:785 stop:1096 length:312 start_codon:yes stop_codon:yes gene_type:complete
MRTVRSYGGLVHQDGTIESKTTYYFDSLEELFDFRDVMDEKHLVDLSKSTIEVCKYVEFNRSMIEGDKENEECINCRHKTFDEDKEVCVNCGSCMNLWSSEEE